MLNFGVTNYWADAGRAAILFAATFAYPINAFPARLAVSSLARLSLDRPIFYYGITLGIFVINLGVALLGTSPLTTVPQVSMVFSVIGSTCAVFVIFIFPGLLAFRTRNRETAVRSIVIASVLITLGTFIGVMGSFTTIEGLIHPVSCATSSDS